MSAMEKLNLTTQDEVDEAASESDLESVIAQCLR